MGSWLTREFCQQGYNVFVLTKSRRTLLFDEPFEIIDCDISSYDSISKCLDGLSFDVVIHAASVNDGFVDGYYASALTVNALGTRNLLEFFKDKPIQNFIYLSTFQVYGKYAGTITESTKTLPKNDYGSTHLFAEIYVRQFFQTNNLPYTILRLTNSYGCPTDLNSSKWYLILNDLSKSALEQKQIILKSNGQAPRDFIWMGTVAKIFAKLTKIPATNDTYNVSGQETLTMEDIAKEVQAAYVKHCGESINILLNQEDKTVYPNDLFVDSSKLRALVNFEDVKMFQNEAINIFKLIGSIS